MLISPPEVAKKPGHVLLLGGTREAAKLAERLTEADIRVTTSLAGRTRSTLPLPGPVRIGGFGGVCGFKRWVRDNDVSHLIDATHPFAARISENAAMAADGQPIAFCRLDRPAWTRKTGDNSPNGNIDNWIDVPDHKAARAALTPYRRIFLAIGRLELGQYHATPDQWFLMRMVDHPDQATPLPDGQVHLGLPGKTVEDEIALLTRHEIDCLVSKNAGGQSSYAKIEAARALGLPVIMIARPPAPTMPENGVTVSTVEAALNWLAL